MRTLPWFAIERLVKRSRNNKTSFVNFSLHFVLPPVYHFKYSSMTRKHQTSSPSSERNLNKDSGADTPSRMVLKYPVFPVSSATIDRLQKLQDYLQVRSKLLLDIRSSSLAALSELQMEEALLENAIRLFPN